MITWTTYGTWLQGDKHGYVNDGKILQRNDTLLQSSLKRLKNPATRLDIKHRDIVRRAILNKAQEIRQHIYAIAVCLSHVHVVAQRSNESVEKVVSFYKMLPALPCDPMVLLEGFGQRVLISVSVLIKKSCKTRLNMLMTIAIKMVSPQACPERGRRVYPEGYYVQGSLDMQIL
jgi:hypothetical protein